MYVWTSCLRILTKSPAIPQQLYKPALRGLSAIAGFVSDGWASCIRSCLDKTSSSPFANSLHWCDSCSVSVGVGTPLIARLVPAHTHAPTRQSLITTGEQNSSCESRGHAWRSSVAIYLCGLVCGLAVLGTPACNGHFCRTIAGSSNYSAVAVTCS